MEAKLLSRSEWSGVLPQFPDRSVYHTGEWLDAVQRTTGLEVHRLGIFGKEGPVFLLPLFERRIAGVPSLLSPPPGLGIEFMGPLYRFPPRAKRDKVEILSEEATGIAIEVCQESWNPALIFLKCTPSILDVRPWQWLGFEPKPLYTYEISLGDGPDAVLASLKKEFRNDLVRTAEKVRIEESDEGAVDVIHSFVNSKFRDQQLTFDVPTEYLKMLFRTLGPKHIRSFLAKVDGHPVAGLIATLYNGRASAWIGARAGGRLPIPLIDHLIWHTIEWGHDRGADVYEIVGANVQRLRAFKAKYNANLSLFFQLERSRLIGKLVAGTYRKTKGGLARMRNR